MGESWVAFSRPRVQDGGAERWVTGGDVRSLVPFAFGGPQWVQWEDGEQGLDWETVCPPPCFGMQALWQAGRTPFLMSTPTPRNRGTGFPQELRGLACGGGGSEVMGLMTFLTPSSPQCPVSSMAGIDGALGRAQPSGPEAEDCGEREGSHDHCGK